MKKKIKLLAFPLILILIIGLAAGCSIEKTAINDKPQETSSIKITEEPTLENDGIKYGAAGALSDEGLTMEEMLVYAIEDEYLAHGEYEYILKTFGDQNPFTNIIEAEEKHISELKILFEDYNIQIPEDISKNYLIVPLSIKEALETGVQAEIDNIKMYKIFLEQELPDDVKDTFTSLMKASENHLAAFEKNLSKY